MLLLVNVQHDKKYIKIFPAILGNKPNYKVIENG